MDQANLNYAQDINEALNEISKEMNKSLPMVIDEYTTLLTTYGGKGKVLYRYALNTEIFSDYNISKDRWIEAQNKSIKNTFCTSPDMSFYRRYDVTVSWNYVDLEGRFITKIELNQKIVNKVLFYSFKIRERKKYYVYTIRD